jgi:hypothetical protein
VPSTVQVGSFVAPQSKGQNVKKKKKDTFRWQDVKLALSNYNIFCLFYFLKFGIADFLNF